jgi:Fe-S-cluster-containing hydrogenase component 2/CRP-like cAMP-binding protein
MAGTGESASDGLAGEAISLEDASKLEFFKSGKRQFKVKLNTNFAGVKAAVRREYQKGDVICKAGDYGSTAFVILEGTATSFVPESAEPHEVRGRSRGSIARLKDLFRRRSHNRTDEPGRVEVGEVSPYASLAADRAPAPVTLKAGDFFGIDTCINFFPRESTVRAEERCVVVEMLRSVLDSIRDAGEAGGKVESAYAESAIRNQLHLHPLFGGLGDARLRQLAEAAELVAWDSDEIKDGLIYKQGDPAESVYFVRSGTIKLSRPRDGGELVFAYLGRGSAFGFEYVLPSKQTAPLVLRCVSHPNEVAPVEVKGTLTLGRSKACDVRFAPDNRAIGRRHCKVEEREGDVYVVDLDSANFTLLNGERIKEAIVAAGDRITIVDYTFEIARAQVESETQAVAPPRLATATGLDNFEVVQIKSAELRRLAGEDAGFRDNVAAVARGLEKAAGRRLPADASIVSELVDLNLYNSQNTLLIDLERCTRCDECVRACSDAHGGVARFTRDGPRFGKYLVTNACRSCTDPKCMVGCPVGSIRREGSLEIRIESWCIGCQRCANQCPFGNINMVELDPKGAPAAPMTEPVTLVAEAAAEPAKLRATVCDLCAGYDGPSCVYACPHDAAIRVNPATYLSALDRQ